MREPCKLLLKRNGHIVLKEEYKTSDQAQSEFLALIRYYKVDPNLVQHLFTRSGKVVWEADSELQHIYIKLKMGFNDEKI